MLGDAFKPESDDVRDSPALNVAGMLQLNGATVDVYDPKAMENSRRVFPTLTASVRAKVIEDGRNCLDVRWWSDVGWRVLRLGAPC